jgi:hypothetical protein
MSESITRDEMNDLHTQVQEYDVEMYDDAVLENEIEIENAENNNDIVIDEVLRLPRELQNIQSWNADPIIAGKRNRRAPERLVFAMIFNKAVREKPDIALKALDIELDVFERKDVFIGRYENDLSQVEKSLIMPNMVNYTEKLTASGDFDKAKSRVLLRGDRQYEVGETEGPVCRVESIFAMFNLVAHLQYEVWKIDFVAAYLNTDMPKELKHRWVLLDRVVSARLVERNPEKWSPFLRSDGKILVEALKLFYGYREAAHYWNKILIEMFTKDRWVPLGKDKCVLKKPCKDGKVALISIVVDDLTCIAPFGSGMKEEIKKLCVDTFKEITMEEGDTINVIGMKFEVDRINKLVKVTQGKFFKSCVEMFDNLKEYPTPFGVDFLEVDESSPVLTDQTIFRSALMTVSFGAHRTYPDLLFGMSWLATHQGKATEQDMKKLKRIMGYIKAHPDHCMVLKPNSLRIVCAADASYGDHQDGKSHSGGVVGFEGNDKSISPVLFICGKQPVVAKSSFEAEIIAASTVGDSFVWLSDFMIEIDIVVEGSVMYQDNKSAILSMEKGGSSFKRTKHIKIRFFWLKALVDEGLLKFEYVQTAEMVADMLTKPLVGPVFQYLAGKLTGWFGVKKLGAGATKTGVEV